ncbi:MAG: hypothetical protein QM831_11080 [Kofleriaceae bacterium]
MDTDYTFTVIEYAVSFLCGFLALGAAAWSGKRPFLVCLGYAILGFATGPIALLALAFGDRRLTAR